MNECADVAGLQTMLDKIKLLFILAVLALSFFVVYIKTETTLVGYELGRLTEKERQLSAKKSRLETQLAKMTDKQNLLKAATQEKQ